MVHVEKPFFYVTRSGHKQRQAAGEFDRLPPDVIEAGRAAKAIRDTTESKQAPRRRRKASG
jgi:hypothetical protein